MDNTFATPVNCHPFQWGCDIVTHSTTKYMDGHALTVGGAIVDSGKFDWNAYADKFPGLTTPDESYHGVTYTQRFGLGGAYITKATVQLMRDLGSIPPHNCFLLNIGLETLPLRMKKHCENAQAVAEYLQGHDKIAWVQYAGLPGRQVPPAGPEVPANGTCGVVIFGVKGGRAAAEKFMAGLKLASIATHVADAKTCVLHPASSTHRQMNDAELAAAGVSPDLVRFSVGIEGCKRHHCRPGAGAGLRVTVSQKRGRSTKCPAPAQASTGGIPMTGETVLMYNCSGPEGAKLRQIFLMLRVRIRQVAPEQYGLTLEELLSRSEESRPVEESFLEPMLVFCGLAQGRLDQILTTMNRAGLPWIALKAMLTPTNKSWNSQQLWTELRLEHEAMTAQQKPRHSKSEQTPE